ncbi:hypothetical protein EUZ85_13420 [Hahella sp. KA22]|uniref:capsular polysaccharide export protein, LipB/KpsS family n=1 Tax=Hahella sp. KA22 TaxID=1628392 RepID=UPI000FDF4572|nr:hypothetical protein [Hahella sp. KA22]AZZ91675.1 hypothetical protein ENC22_10860 [Hahella sp. KA22]QAY55045.1 hypothetical protein EUZ85_13420 [Hahella sp. KA22]
MKKIALVSYPGQYFLGFAKSLEETGFEVYWICITTSEYRVITEQLRIPRSRVLDTNAGFRYGMFNEKECRDNLAAIEQCGSPKINNIILMDRILNKIRPDDALCYMEHLRRVITDFLAKNEINLVSSGRDTALQLMTMMVCRSLDIPWIVPTRLRIPLNTYGFCTTHETDTLITFRKKSKADYDWAHRVLHEFKEAKQRPALKISARSLRDTVKLLKPHAAVFANLLDRSKHDKGNNWSRYTLPRIVTMYMRRRVNMILFNLFKPWSAINLEREFYIYALHTQPESSIDVAGAYFSDQISLITFVARSIPVGSVLLVKIHPTDIDGKSLRFYRKISQIPGVKLVHDQYDSRTLIERAKIVFTLTGTIGHEAGLMGKKVITFANNYYNDLPTVRLCKSPTDLPELIHDLDHEDLPPEELKTRIIEFLSDCRSKVFDGEVNRMFGENPRALSEDDLENLKKAYAAVYDYFYEPCSHSVYDGSLKLTGSGG